jgi:hypothetical protein
MIARSAFLVLLAVLAAGCKPVRLKTPDFVAGARELQVRGYKRGSHGFRESDIALGSYRVTGIDHDWDRSTSVKAGPRASESRKKAFRFDLRAEGRTLRGECTEEARRQGIGGFLSAKIALRCACSEGEAPRLSLALDGRSGTVQAAGVAYQVAELRDSASGGKVREALGYELRGPVARGAVDVSASGRAWLPTGVSADEELALVCAYASLLLYRPTTTLD